MSRSRGQEVIGDKGMGQYVFVEQVADISVKTTGEYGENLQTDRAGDGERGEKVSRSRGQEVIGDKGMGQYVFVEQVADISVQTTGEYGENL